MKHLPCSNCIKIIEVPSNTLIVWCDDCGESIGAKAARREAELYQKGLEEGLKQKPKQWSGLVNFSDKTTHYEN